ncbi:MAG: aspartate aminotransferase family protein [SAR116 cluster bacterium]|nr:aspartate aminotransferase family protein [Paracoccaceae bacterium]RCL81362.1 MAG: aspartate aminotransferase family protein [SAR116 cluster bacterium]RPH14056.1 MAG: aspartate aminotransferase family protein [Alphaproteobacteria bacterium TMED150]HBQ22193.1 aspartate aminotransferase family protein [Alphaproteobacteria bacterium]
MDQFQNNDLDAFWMPFTANRDFKENPRMLVSADGLYYRESEGRRILDAAAGLWCVNAGHNHPKIKKAITDQLDELDYAPNFQFGHPLAFKLANKLKQFFPGDLNHAFFTSSGSESVDTALKIALAYQRAKGQGSRTRLIGRERGYHGTGFGGISVGGIVKNRMYFGSLLAGVDHLRHTYQPEHGRFIKGQPSHGAELADDLLRLIALHDASTIAAVIVEPMAGSTGVLIPPLGYLERLREICDQHGILLIFDEVISAYGRLGYTSAAERLNVIPDLMATAKGLTNGVVPMGAVMARQHIYDTMMEQADAPIELFHGYTYSGHPLACAAALATIAAYEEEKMFDHAARQEEVFARHVHGLQDARHVADIRSWGLVAGIELHPREGAVGARGMALMKACYAHGVMVRFSGDIIALSPPLMIGEEEIISMVATIRKSLDEVE